MHVEVNQSEVRPTEVMVHEYSSPVQHREGEIKGEKRTKEDTGLK